jgi:transposase
MSFDTAARPKPKRQRRTFADEFKRDLVAQTLAPGVSVSSIALANGINTNQLFAWRRQFLAATEPQRASLLPVHLDLSEVSTTPVHTPSASTASPEGHIEIVLGRATLRLHGHVHPDSLRLVLQCLPR